MIKNCIIDLSMKSIIKNYPEYNEEKLLEIRYGLEAIYLNITKIFVILILSIILNIIKETVLLLIAFNILRTTGFGIHASKSWMCWISSITIFIGVPLLIKYLYINDYIIYIFAFISTIALAICAPADTKKRPLIRPKKRLIYKILTIILAISFLIATILINNNALKLVLTSALLIEAILTNPVTYRMFKLPYNNYKTYK